MRVSAGMKALFAVSPCRLRDQDSARRIEASRGIPTSLSQCTSTAYSCEHFAVLILAVMYVLAPVAVAQTGTAALNQSQCSGSQIPCGSSSAPVGQGASHAETTPPDVALAEAKSLLQKGLVAQAEKVTRQFLLQHADSAEGHYLLGYILFDEVREKYVGEEEKEGENFRYKDTVSASLGEIRDAKARESLVELSAGVRYGSPSAFDLKIVALNYLLLKDEPSAEKWLTASTTLNSQDAQAWYYLGRTKYSETKYAGAIEAFEHCLKLDPENVVAEYNVGLSYEGLNQNDEAIQAYQNAIAWESQHQLKSPDPFVALARLYLHQNQPEKAVPYLFQAVTAFPQLSLPHEELGKAYSVLHRLPEAQEQLEKAVQLSPQNASLRCLLGQVYQQEKMTAKAQTEFERCTLLRNKQSAPEGNQAH
jgi:tetratricopeptide (TPR) repeat protein